MKSSVSSGSIESDIKTLQPKVKSLHYTHPAYQLFSSHSFPVSAIGLNLLPSSVPVLCICNRTVGCAPIPICLKLKMYLYLALHAFNTRVRTRRSFRNFISVWETNNFVRQKSFHFRVIYHGRGVFQVRCSPVVVPGISITSMKWYTRRWYFRWWVSLRRV